MFKEITVKDWHKINQYLGVAFAARDIGDSIGDRYTKFITDDVTDEYLSKATSLFEQTQGESVPDKCTIAVNAFMHLIRFIAYAQIVLDTDTDTASESTKLLYQWNKTRAKIHLQDFQFLFHKLAESETN